MGATVEVVLSNRNVSFRFCDEKNSKKFVDNLSNWSKFVMNSVAYIVENKSAVVQVYSSDGEFRFPTINAKQWNQKHDGITYFIAGSSAWNKTDMLEITSLMEFELSALWIQLLPEIDESKINCDQFFKLANKIISGEEVDDTNYEYECIGNIEDGAVVMWENPDWNKVNYSLPQLQEICSTNGLEWKVTDSR